MHLNAKQVTTVAGHPSVSRLREDALLNFKGEQNCTIAKDMSKIAWRLL